MGKLDRGRRFDILRRDGFRCRYCGVQAVEAELHVDHLRPRAEGGTDHPSNLVTACVECNGGKRTKLIDGDTSAGWQSLVGRHFSWTDDDGALAGKGLIVADQGHGYFLVEYFLPAMRQGHRVAHLSTMHAQSWLLSTTVPMGGEVRELPPATKPIRRRDTVPAAQRTLRCLDAGTATVAELRVATGLSQPAVSTALTALESSGKAQRIGKRGRADLWRSGSTEEGVA